MTGNCRSMQYGDNPGDNLREVSARNLWTSGDLLKRLYTPKVSFEVYKP